MTVNELRHLLFDIKDQEAEIAVVTQISYGQVVQTATIAVVESNMENEKVPKGFCRIQLG